MKRVQNQQRQRSASQRGLLGKKTPASGGGHSADVSIFVYFLSYSPYVC